jgi:hypothetical protein
VRQAYSKVVSLFSDVCVYASCSGDV